MGSEAIVAGGLILQPSPVHRGTMEMIPHHPPHRRRDDFVKSLPGSLAHPGVQDVGSRNTDVSHLLAGDASDGAEGEGTRGEGLSRDGVSEVGEGIGGDSEDVSDFVNGHPRRILHHLPIFLKATILFASAVHFLASIRTIAAAVTTPGRRRQILPSHPGTEPPIPNLRRHRLPLIPLFVRLLRDQLRHVHRHRLPHPAETKVDGTGDGSIVLISLTGERRGERSHSLDS
mmetsp:Transcript_19510/g.40069  ORF Transcript_19510/g.40069 Transcript_19510/m.40069 type:complete len:230 (+) Transcript_19510:1226-1915(+)